MNEASLKSKLKSLSKETGKTFNELFKQLIFERFLARISQSPHRNSLIFKGGLCLRQYVEINRETKDLDFLIKKANAEKAHIDSIFKEISALDLGDNFQFHKANLTELEVEHKKYPGFRIKIPVTMGNMKDNLQIDIGIGDFVQEKELEVVTLDYKDAPMFDQKAISVLAYPPEYIFSEKLQAITQLKALNSRMKDYFDCYTLIKEDVMDLEEVKQALSMTFKLRDTDLVLVSDYSNELTQPWKAFTKKVDDTPENLSVVIGEINSYLTKNNMIS